MQDLVACRRYDSQHAVPENAFKLGRRLGISETTKRMQLIEMDYTPPYCPFMLAEEHDASTVQGRCATGVAIVFQVAFLGHLFWLLQPARSVVA